MPRKAGITDPGYRSGSHLGLLVDTVGRDGRGDRRVAAL
jgi:hypothetical protein